ncbi:MAG: type toxin-antitoxin system RatA family toxin [Burkholderiaceae bacterium]|nr:type toxin-antitoxin system RatA family toxin [Burkholderiaceae bacterium]
MGSVRKSILLNYSAQQMYALVERIEEYPQFLPWCGGVDVARDGDDGTVTATLTLDIHGLRQSFTTRNRNVPGQSIAMSLVDGPFRTLRGGWLFKPLGDDGCKVDFGLEYEFSNPVLAGVVGPVFQAVTASFVESFRNRAKEIYG